MLIVWESLRGTDRCRSNLHDRRARMAFRDWSQWDLKMKLTRLLEGWWMN